MTPSGRRGARTAKRSSSAVFKTIGQEEPHDAPCLHVEADSGCSDERGANDLTLGEVRREEVQELCRLTAQELLELTAEH